MGEVWRAKDTKLGREVAIKTLPEEFAKDTDRLARFEREAKLLASLNHPNIAAIHGFEEDNGTHFLVMELVEGDTLADRVGRGAIPVEESLKLALQIAEALRAISRVGGLYRQAENQPLASNLRANPWPSQVKSTQKRNCPSLRNHETRYRPARSPAAAYLREGRQT